MITCNIRALSGPLTGVQRYTVELLTRFGGKLSRIAPSRPLHGIQGHLWEQVVLPMRFPKGLLWSPCNTGPLSVEKQVVTIHDVSPLDNPGWTSARFASWYRFLTPRLVRRVRSVLTVSNFSKQRILDHCPNVEEKIHVVYQAVDKRFSPVDQALVERARNKLKIPTPHYLFALGSIEPRKNLRRLLQAWEQIHSIIPVDVWLVIAGAQGEKGVFGAFSLDSLPPRVHLTGRVPDDLLPALYSGAILSPYLSLYEGFGFPPLEAMACGTPVLTSNIASLPEVVGNAGMTVDAYDVESIADGLMQLIGDSGLRADFKLRGLERAKLFSWNETAEKTWKVLQQAAQS